MEFKIIYEDENLLVVDKPAGIAVFPEGGIKEKTLINALLEIYPELRSVGELPRLGIVHRLDKDTSGILLVAKNNETLEFLQNQFKNRKVFKKYLALVKGRLKNKEGIIETLLGRNPRDSRKQKVFFPGEPNSENKRKAITEYKVIKEFKDCSLVEVFPKTGRKHQIRVHFSFLGHPIIRDKLYGFKNSVFLIPSKGEKSRQFLHAAELKIKMPDGKEKTFVSELPEDLKILLH